MAENDILLLHPNNVYPKGGVEELLTALALLPSNYKLCFLGEFRQTGPAIVKLISNLGIASRIVFREPVPPGQLISYSSGADIAILPLHTDVANHRHCLPNRVFESIAARNPILAPNNTEIGHFIKEHKIGITFQSFAPKTMANAIIQIAKFTKAGEFDSPMEKAATELTWENEEEKLRSLVGDGNDKSCLILACKNIDTNDRISRQSSTMLNAGYRVTVLANNSPAPHLKVDGVRYLAITRNQQ